MKIVVVGLGYVGLSNAVLLAQHNEVIGVDIDPVRVDALNRRSSPILDTELTSYLERRKLNLSASTDLESSVYRASYVIVCTPTNYDEDTHYFDTSSVEEVIKRVVSIEPDACIVVKSTIPIGFIDKVNNIHGAQVAFFSPEFLREGKALHDNLFPSRIIIGEKSKRAAAFADLLAEGAIKKNIPIVYMGAREAEAVKLFSNTYLAMRVAFFNELDSFALAQDLHSQEIIDGVSLDPRIGQNYNNPSFGYGGYCLPKDTKQLQASYNSIPQNLISAIVDSNSTRIKFLVDYVVAKKPERVGIYRLVMKDGSDNFRQSALSIISKILSDKCIEVIIFEPLVSEPNINGIEIVNDLDDFKSSVSLILANRLDENLKDVASHVFTRDIFGTD